MLKRKVISITNPYQDSEQVIELERLLNQGWDLVNSIANKYAILYILEKYTTTVDTVLSRETNKRIENSDWEGK